jgi:hypothetical protein
VVFKFQVAPSADYSVQASPTFTQKFTSRLASVTAQFPGLGPVLPQFTAVDQNRLEQLLDSAGHSQGAPQQMFEYLKYYTAAVPAGVNARIVAAAFQPSDTLGLEYAVAEVSGEGGAYAADPREIYQHYWNPRPQGIGRNAIAGHSGGDGLGAKVGVVGLGFQPAHPEGFGHVLLVHGVHSSAVEDIAHGNATLGILCAPLNATGIAGASSTAARVYYASALLADGSQDIPNALLTLVDQLSPGDVIQIELQTARDAALPSSMWHMPIEVEDSIWQVIRLATALGIAVVEPAGNGDRDLDLAAMPAGYRALSRTVLGAEDSYAVLVGASMDTSGVAAAERWNYGTDDWGDPVGSNYGSRVDCFGPGQNVYSCWYNAGVSPYYVSDYWGSFNGTSSATAVVAAAALLLISQARAERAGGWPSVLQQRWLISDTATNTPSFDPTKDRIGAMPDLLAAAKAMIAGLPDLYIREDAADQGAPNNAATMTSPDILLRPVSEGDESADLSAGGALVNGADVSIRLAAGADIHVYARGTNRGTADASNVMITVYWTDPDTMKATDEWSKIGSATIAKIPSGSLIACSPPILWKKESLPGGKRCLLMAVLDHSSDPTVGLPSLNATAVAAIAPGGTVLELVSSYSGSQNNVALRLFTMLETKKSKDGS